VDGCGERDRLAGISHSSPNIVAPVSTGFYETQ